MKKTLLICAAITLSASLSGCGTLLGNHDRMVAVNSAPRGSTVFLNGEEMGRTPTTIALGNPISNSYTVKITHAGYSSVVKHIESELQPIAVLNVLFWPGFLIDAVSGDLMRYNTMQIDADLQKK